MKFEAASDDLISFIRGVIQANKIRTRPALFMPYTYNIMTNQITELVEKLLERSSAGDP